MPVPSIDTRSASESHQTSPRGFTSSWPMTPPQSAFEPRRPSLAYSSVSDASTSGPSSSCDYSQPATPVNPLGHSNDHFAHTWNTATIADQCSLVHVTQGMYNPSIVNAISGVDMTGYSPVKHHNSAEAYTQSPMRDAWNHSNTLHLDSDLKATLFQTTQGLGQSANNEPIASSMYANPASSIHQPSLEPSAFQDFSNVPMYPPPQVVVPSHVSPQDDYPMDQYPGYDANDQAAEEFSRSFGSSTTGYSGWEPVGQQSPGGEYYAQSEDDDYVLVKDEVFRSPAPRQFRSPHRVNRRASRRNKRSLPTSHVLAEHDHFGFTIRFEGKEWEHDVNGRPVAKHPDESKPQRCTQVDENGKQCPAKFNRSEHLKRHMTKHSQEKPFPCPLEGCTTKQAMSRPDNAGDHFKTHLKGPAKGKRNKECTLEELAAAMENDPRWDDKKTTKMLTNLQKWLPEYLLQQQDARRMKALEDETKARAECMHPSRRMHC